MKHPTPCDVIAAREAAGLTQAQAAELVHAASYRTWQNWEADECKPEHRKMGLAEWDLFLSKIKTLGRRKMKSNTKGTKPSKPANVTRRGGRVTMEFRDRGVVISGGRRGVDIISKIFRKQPLK